MPHAGLARCLTAQVLANAVHYKQEALNGLPGSSVVCSLCLGVHLL